MQTTSHVKFPKPWFEDGRRTVRNRPSRNTARHRAIRESQAVAR